LIDIKLIYTIWYIFIGGAGKFVSDRERRGTI